MSEDLIDTTEMYAKTVFELQEMGIAPLRARIAERFEHSGPTVSQTVARMERDGWLHVGDDRVLHLTDAGQRLATNVMRKHRLAERHLLDVIGVGITQVHAEACRWEHVMSDAVAERIARALTPPFVDPFGNPIPVTPGSEATPAMAPPTDDQPLVEAVGADAPHTVVVGRMGEWIQAHDGLLDQCVEQGVLPGAVITARATDHGFVLTGPTGPGLLLDRALASHLWVAPAML